MAGRNKAIRDVQAQQYMRALYPEELKEGRDVFGNFFPQAARNIVKLAEGFEYDTLDKTGNLVTVTQPPDLKANVYIIDRFLGTPSPETSPILDRLNTARADFMENQLTLGFIEAQVKEIMSRAERQSMETKMWPQQFVTEEKQQQQLQTVASELLRRLMAQTPEEFGEIVEAHGYHGGDSSAALEAMKGKIGVELAEVMEAVLGREDEVDGDEEDEED